MKRTLIFLIVLAVAGLAFASMELSSARLYRKQGEWLKSLQFYDQAAQIEKENPEVYFERGQLYCDIARDTSKVDMARQIAGSDPNPERVLYTRMLADFKTALTPTDKSDQGLLKKLKKKVDSILDERWMHFYADAVGEDTMYTYVSKESKDSIEIAKHRYLPKGLLALDYAIMMLPDKWNAYGMKAQIYTKLDSTRLSAENWGFAIQKIESAEKAQRESEDYKNGLAIALEALMVDYYNLGKPDSVMKYADRVLAQEPLNINAIELRANILAQKAADTTLTKAERDSLKMTAITALKKAANADTANADIDYTLGQFYLELGDTTQTVAAFQDVLRKNPKDHDVKFALGVLYLEGGSFVNTDKARETFQQLTEANPEDGPSWINYGVALIRLGKNVEGKEAVERGQAIVKGGAAPK
jgi:tetratricopeptide (TPR) repeat protein